MYYTIKNCKSLRRLPLTKKKIAKNYRHGESYHIINIWKLNLIFIYLRYFFVFVYKKNSIHIDALVWYVFLTYLFLKITVNIYHKQTIFLCYASIWNVLWAHLFEQISNHICYIQIIFRHELAYVDLKYLAH